MSARVIEGMTSQIKQISSHGAIYQKLIYIFKKLNFTTIGKRQKIPPPKKYDAEIFKLNIPKKALTFNFIVLCSLICK